MSKLVVCNQYLAILCQWIGVFFLFAIMMVTITDIVTRTLFSMTSGEWSWYVKGSVELVSYGLLLALLAGFAGVVEHAQIIVDVFSRYIATTIQHVIAILTLLFYTIIGGLITVGFIDNAKSANEYGEMTQDLRIPLCAIFICATVLTVLFTIRALLSMIELFKDFSFNKSHSVVIPDSD